MERKVWMLELAEISKTLGQITVRAEVGKVVESNKVSNLSDWVGNDVEMQARGEVLDWILDVLNVTIFNQGRTIIWLFKTWAWSQSR